MEVHDLYNKQFILIIDRTKISKGEAIVYAEFLSERAGRDITRAVVRLRLLGEDYHYTRSAQGV